MADSFDALRKVVHSVGLKCEPLCVPPEGKRPIVNGLRMSHYAAKKWIKREISRLYPKKMMAA
jgi:hypothetical protein